MALLSCPGGAERFAFELMGALGRRHRVRAAVVGEPGPVASIATHAPGVELIAERPPPDSAGMRWSSRLRRSEAVGDLVRALLADDPPDVVVSHLDAGAGALAAAREDGVPAVLLLAGYGSLFSPAGADLPEPERLARLRLRAGLDGALASAAAVVASSHAMAAACERVCARRPAVASPVVRRPAPVRSRPDGHVVLVASQWTAQKGVELVAPIAARLPRRAIAVQAPNGFPEEHRRAVTALPNVRLEESASALGPLFDGAAVVLVPAQLPEPFGRVAFEAMAAGLPVLASASGGLPEFVPSRQLVRDYADPDAWARAARGLEDRSAWRPARAGGLAAAERVLSSDAPARIEDLLHRATRRHAVAL